MKAACTETWLRFTGIRSTTGGVLSTTSTSEESCLTECLSNSACVFVDYAVTSSPQQCWIHTSAADLNQVSNVAGFNQYVLSRRCSTADRKYL